MVLSSGQAAIFAGGEQISTAGTIIATKDSATIAGTSTAFVTHGVKEDDIIYINFHPYHVKAVASATSLTIKETYRGGTTGATNYAIYRPVRNILLENFTVISDLRGNNGGILFAWAEEVSINQVKVRSFSGQGITIRGVFNFRVENCETYGNTGTGIEVEEVATTDLLNNGIIKNCLSWSNDNRGINIEGNSMVRVLGCTANGNNLGIRVASAETHISGCNAEFNALDGIRLDDASYCQVVGNNASSNAAYGITLVLTSTGSNNNTVQGNNCDLNPSGGIFVDGDSNSIVGNTIDQNNVEDSSGILLDTGSDNNTVTGNTIIDAEFGINVDSSLNSIGNNTISINNIGSDIGIWIQDDADNNSITGNTVDGNGAGLIVFPVGINLDAGATGNKISNNVLTGLITKLVDAGTGTIIASKFIPLNPPVEVLNTDPTSGSAWTDLDVTAQTTADTYAVEGKMGLNSVTTVGRQGFVRVNGSSEGQGNTTLAVRSQVVSQAAYCSFKVKVDSGQIFEWSVNNADVSALVIEIWGYWEYTY